MTDNDQTELDIELDDLRKTDQAVMVRIVEWGEWIPSGGSDIEKLPLHNGYTGFSTGKSEKLIEVLAQNTMQDKLVTTVDRVSGKETDAIYTYYVFQAVLVQNVSENLLEGLMKVQRPIEPDPNTPRDKRSDLVVIQNGQPVKPNRQEVRRHVRKTSG
jgi:hypothetical protein